MQKEQIMELSSSVTDANASVDAMKKALESQQNVSKLIETASQTQNQEQEQAQQRVQETKIAEKTGMGNNLDLMS